ncbi:MAG: tetratricopeptide repeat protein [Planctomycetaceae bacterium]
MSEHGSNSSAPVIPLLKVAARIRIALLVPICLCLVALLGGGFLLANRESPSSDESAAGTMEPAATNLAPANSLSPVTSADLQTTRAESTHREPAAAVNSELSMDTHKSIEERLHAIVLSRNPDFQWPEPATPTPSAIRLVSDEVIDDIEQPRRLTNTTPIDLEQIDQVILKGGFPFAAELLEESSHNASGMLEVQIRLRQGLCAELLGDSAQAFRFYRSLILSHPSTAVSDAATLACARTLMERNHRDVAAAMLMGLLLGREHSLDKALLGDLVHLLATAMSASTAEQSLLDDDQWLVPVRHPAPEEMLNHWRIFETLPSTASPVQRLNLRALTTTPQGVLVTISNNELSVERILSKLTNDLQWTLSISSSLRSNLAARISTIDCEDLPLDVVLDCLLQPLNAEWDYADRTLSISSTIPERTTANREAVNETSRDVQEQTRKQRRIQMQLRFQQLAVSLAPEHPSAPVSYLMLGATAAAQNELEQAIAWFRMSIDLFPRSAAAGAATFNLGKANLLLGRRDKALTEFYRTVDGASWMAADAIGYLYVGRLLLENDSPREAVPPLMSGLSLAEGTIYEGPAALLLSAAYLMSGNAVGANQVLVDHHAAFEPVDGEPEELAAMRRRTTHDAAFLSSLARFWGSHGRQRIREGHALLSSLTNVHPDQMFGRHCGFLVGVAFGAVGLQAEQMATYQACLEDKHPYPLQHRIRLLLTGRIGSDDSLNRSVTEADPAATDTTEPSDTPSPTADAAAIIADQQATLARAEAAFRSGRHDAALEFCRGLLVSRADIPETAANDVQQVKRMALRIAGLVYQAQGKHQDAVGCFAGVLPEEFRRPRTSDRNAHATEGTGS